MGYRAQKQPSASLSLTNAMLNYEDKLKEVRPVKMRFLGAAGQVTGSGCLMETGGHTFLVDFGQFQGENEIARQNAVPLDFDAAKIEFVLLTHAHIDHSGRLPLLYKNGFRGKIFCTYPTSALADILLKDSGKIHEEEIEWENRKRLRAGLDAVEPLYTLEDAEMTVPYLYPVPYRKKHEISPDFSFVFYDAGHLLGSSSIRIEWLEDGAVKSMIFSGDLGTYLNPLLPEPDQPEPAQALVIESTYGLEYHHNLKRRAAQLAEIVEKTLEQGGTVLIPSFAVGRTQEIIFELRQYYENDNRLDAFRKIPIYVDSPLAINATGLYEKFSNYFRPEIMAKVQGDSNPFDAPNVTYVSAHDASIALDRSPQPKVIISASGMCEAGRIRHHLKHYLWKKETTLVFIGFQAVGTMGRALENGLKDVKLFNDDIHVNARVEVVEGFSGHADQAALDRWLEPLESTLTHLFVNHGEAPRSAAFADTMQTRLPNVRVVVADPEEVYTL
jgi:metallo-beta-lactamase family protein